MRGAIPTSKSNTLYRGMDATTTVSSTTASTTEAIFNDNFLFPSADNIQELQVCTRDGNNNNAIWLVEPDKNCFGDENSQMNDENDDVFCDNENYAMNDNSSYTTTDADNHVLLQAAREAYRNQSLTPLLKHELHYLIQVRRVSQGKDEMRVQFEDRGTPKLSQDEQERVERRRSQNRMAARRFRQKRKMSEEGLTRAVQTLQQTNLKLLQKVQQLREEKQLLMETVADHLLICPSLSQVPQEVLDAATVP